MDKFTLADNIRRLNAEVERISSECGATEKIRIVGASKTTGTDVIRWVNEIGGLFALGENKADELENKFEYLTAMPWHFIGVLQTNKARKVVGRVSLIHSLDRISLAKEIDRLCAVKGMRQDCLVQINMGKEPAKSGVFPEDTENFIRSLENFKNIRLRGLTAVMPIAESETRIKLYGELKTLFTRIKSMKTDNFAAEYLSAGMSDDYAEAVKYGGANMIRIGKTLFGERNYAKD